MGRLIEGEWHKDDPRTDSAGHFIRTDSPFRDSVTAENDSRFCAEVDRYHLIISLACPWAHRALIVRSLKGLQNAISLSVVGPEMTEEGWIFSNAPGCTGEPLFGATALHEVYRHADPTFSGRVTVPVLWDKQHATIVNNESAEIMKMFNSGFAAIATPEPDLYPLAIRTEIDDVNARVFADINNGVYQAGFATTQAAYEEAFTRLFTALDWTEARLGRTRYLCGNVITEADWRLFTTIVRFDLVYFSHFKCNLRRISDYSNLYNYLKDLYQLDGISNTCDFSHIKQHYYGSHPKLNPTKIVPKGPVMDLGSPHDRDRF